MGAIETAVAEHQVDMERPVALSQSQGAELLNKITPLYSQFCLQTHQEMCAYCGVEESDYPTAGLAITSSSRALASMLHHKSNVRPQPSLAMQWSMGTIKEMVGWC